MRSRLLLLLVALGSVPLSAAEWPQVVKAAEAKVPRVEVQAGGAQSSVCSAVVFGIDAQGTVEAFTAAHCVDYPPSAALHLTVNRQHAAVVFTNRLLDLAVVTFVASGKEQAVAFAPETPLMGTEVAVLGYAFGDRQLSAQFGHVSQPPSDDGTFRVNADLIFGQSGGLLMDSQGRLIGINSHIRYAGADRQMAHVAGIVPVEVLVEFLKAYEREKRRRE